MKKRLHTLFGLVVAMVLMAPAAAFASDDEPKILSKFENYTANVKGEDSTALTWLLFILLAGICVSVLFKSANRSHLD